MATCLLRGSAAALPTPHPLLQVWLPLLPRVGAEGFEVVNVKNWSLRCIWFPGVHDGSNAWLVPERCTPVLRRQFKGAVYDAVAQQVRFAPAADTPATAAS